jgi:glucosylceramidase
LDSFDISHDLKYRIPFIKAAMAAAGNQLSLFVSP